MRKFKVVGRASSSAIFDGEERMTAHGNFGGHRLHFLIGTHLEKPHGEGVPRGIFVEISGEAEQLSGAAELFTNRADVLLGILATGANAFIDHLECEIVFEVTEGVTEREFLQILIPRAPTPAFPARRIKKTLVGEFMKAILVRDDQRILRAIAHYREMLANWYLEERLRCVTHAFVAAEALGPLALRREIEGKGIGEEQLAQTLGVDMARQNWKNDLLGKVREIYIFHGDRDCYQSAKDASDAFEHSYRDFDTIRRTAESVVSRTAAHVRQAILELGGVPEDVKAELLAEPLNKPLGPPRLVHYLFGRLIGDGRELAAPDQAYPIVHWRRRFIPSRDPTSGEVEFKIQESITPRLAEGISLRLDKYEAWIGSRFVEPGEGQDMLKQAGEAKIELASGEKPEIDGAFAQDPPGTESLMFAVGGFIANCGGLAATLKVILNEAVQDRVKRRRARDIGTMARAIIEHMTRGGQVEPDLVSLLEQVAEIEAARRIITEGVMLVGWQGRAVGKPKHAMMVRTRRSRGNAPKALEEEEVRQLSQKAAAIARRLQAWCVDKKGRHHNDADPAEHGGPNEEGVRGADSRG